jgi:hypothetical protein
MDFLKRQRWKLNASRKARGKMGYYLIVFGEEVGGNQLHDGQ